VDLAALSPVEESVQNEWALRRRLRHETTTLPWAGFALIMAPFLIDVTGNTLNLYDTVLGEWYTFIRHGTELETAYEDTLGDETLGSIGAGLAGILVARLRRLAQASGSRSL
jgi:hypothetical protein